MEKAIVAVLIVAGLAISGCSWSMVTKAPSKDYRDKVEYSECTQAPAAPIVDSVLGVAAVTSGIYLHSNAPNPSFDSSGSIKKGVQGTAIGIGVSSLLFFGSASYGYYQVVQCNKYWSTH